jgi:hypothetical protein
MLLSIENIKNLLKFTGIRDLIVKFDSKTALIHVSFTYQEKNYEHKISFKEIEAAFSNGNPTQQDVVSCNNPVGGV